MILKESRELEWIQQLRIRYPYTNPTLIEKAIRTFSLLEALVVSGCPFVFKGGTALMLHLNSAKRISIDVDIICEPGTDVIGYLNKTAQDYGFGEVEPGERVSRTNIPKTHAKCYYTVSYRTNPLLLAGEEEERGLSFRGLQNYSFIIVPCIVETAEETTGLKQMTSRLKPVEIIIFSNFAPE